MSITLIHLSDLHFHSLPRDPFQWLTKRGIGAANLLVRKRRLHPLSRNQKLVTAVSKMEFDHLIISGDLTYLSLKAEFQLAHQTLKPLLANAEKVTIAPGNHDRYVKEVCGKGQDLFQQYFGTYFSQDLIHTRKLDENWHLIGWDSCHPNDWLRASGTVRNAVLRATEEYMAKQPEPVGFVLVNHYPVWFPQGYRVHDDHELYNLAQVRTWLMRQDRIRLYLHGHVHHNWHQVIERQGPPLHVVNSASSSEFPPREASSFHRIDLNGEKVSVTPLNF